jgi:uncharacterized membrane protein YheB (UPF0754 family)
MEDYYKLAIVIAIPLISGSIGWFTNYIAIKMLFYPRVKKSFFFFQLHGVFPKRQGEIANKLGDLFAEELGVQSKIESQLQDVLNDTNMSESIKNKVNSLALDFIKQEVPFMAPMVPPELIENLSGVVAVQLETHLKEELKKGGRDLSNKIDVRSMVREQIQALEVESLEGMLQNLLKKEFRFIELSGAVLGFVIGCIQLLLTYFLFNISNG